MTFFKKIKKIFWKTFIAKNNIWKTSIEIYLNLKWKTFSVNKSNMLTVQVVTFSNENQTSMLKMIIFS